MGSIEDVQYLMENSTEESYMYNVNSSSRDRRVWPYPNQYQITFDSPFRQVIGIDVVDATIPRTQYSVDDVNNTLVIDVGNGPVMIEIANGDHTDTSLIAALNDKLSLYGITTAAESNPPELRNMLTFTSATPFHLLMGSSTIRPVLGFDEDAAGHEYLNKRFRCVDPVTMPGTYSSITEHEVQVFAYEGPQAVELAIPFAGPNGSPARYIAQKFVASKTGLLKEIRIACAISDDADDRVIDWYITTNDPVQEQPDAILYSGAQIPAVDYPTPDQNISGFTTSGDISSIGAAISAGTEYWVVYACSTTVGEVDLYYGTPTVASANQLLYSTDGSTWSNGAVSGQDITHKSVVMTVVVTQGTQTITAPGILNLVGDSYCVLRIPEIESHIYKGRSYEKHSFGLALFKLAVVGYATSRFDYSSVPYRRFHPIGQLTSMTLNFYRPNGQQLYMFHGVNHNLIMVVRYLIPKMRGSFDNKVLNPFYDPDPLKRLDGLHGDESDSATTDEELDSESEEELELAGPSAIHKYVAYEYPEDADVRDEVFDRS